MPFLRAATRNLSPESSAQSQDFNLKRLLFCRGNHGRLFQQNRPGAVIQRKVLSKRRQNLQKTSTIPPVSIYLPVPHYTFGADSYRLTAIAIRDGKLVNA
jgi:hypothetical protein